VHTTVFKNENHIHSGVQAIFILTIIIYLLHIIIDRFADGLFISILGLSWKGVVSGKIWQFVSYQFLHANFWHLFINLFVLAFLGREVEETIGTFKFILAYLLCGIIGGIGWLLLSYKASHSVCVGASGAIFGIAGLFAGLFPHREIYLLLFFVLPLKMSARIMAIIFGAISLLAVVGGEGGVAHSAHLAGGIGGYFYGASLRRRGVLFNRPFSLIDIWHKWKNRLKEPPAEFEINAVLDKISRNGIASLTLRERRILSRAKQYGIKRQL